MGDIILVSTPQYRADCDGGRPGGLCRLSRRLRNTGGGGDAAAEGRTAGADLFSAAGGATPSAARDSEIGATERARATAAASRTTAERVCRAARRRSLRHRRRLWHRRLRARHPQRARAAVRGQHRPAPRACRRPEAKHRRRRRRSRTSRRRSRQRRLGRGTTRRWPTGRAPPRAGGEAPVVDEDGFIWPVNGDVISDFGAKGSGLVNDGINIAASRGNSGARRRGRCRRLRRQRARAASAICY